MGPGAKHKQYLREVCRGRAPSTLNLPLSPLTTFCKLEQFGYGDVLVNTSRLFDVMYLTLTVLESCLDTLEVLIVVLSVLLHLCRDFST